MNNFCLYKHTCPNGKIYIGITSQNPLYRWNSGNGYSRNKYFFNAIQKYGWENIKHEILFENLKQEEAEHKEIELIAKYKSNQKEYGYNISTGGNGANGVKITEETKRKMSEAHKGLERNETYRKNISLSKMGAKNGMFNKKDGLHHNSKKIIQIDTKKNVVRMFNSISGASRFLKTINPDISNEAYKNISACCSGKRKTAYGFIWRYKEVA